MLTIHKSNPTAAAPNGTAGNQNTRLKWIAIIVATCSMVAACGSAPTLSTAQILANAEKTINGVSSIHVTLTSQNISGSGIQYLGGNGDIVRPDKFQGTLEISTNGLPVDLGIIAINESFYLQFPFQQKYVEQNPATYGFENPASLLNPKTGIFSWLSNTNSATGAPSDRYNGEQLDEIDVSLPGSLVATLLPDAAPDVNVTAQVGIDASTFQLRKVVFQGPFAQAKVTSTYTLILDQYGEKVTITPPA